MAKRVSEASNLSTAVDVVLYLNISIQKGRKVEWRE